MSDVPDGRASWAEEPPDDYKAAHPDWEKPAPDPTAPEMPASRLRCVGIPKRSVKDIPPRQWAYGRFLSFGRCAILASMDGVGKGCISTVMALSFVTGRALLGEKVWRTGPVCVVSYEDDLLEWERRIAAACVHFNIDHDFARENIHFIMRDDDSRVTFAEYSERKVVFPDRDEIIDLIKGQKAVCLMIDPFNLAHDMDDGNNNVMIAKVAREIDYICARTNVAGLALHHLRKGSTGALDDLMGATSLRATFRSVRLLMRMTSKQGEDLKIEDAWRHIQIASTKANFAPPPDKAVWFKLISIDLGNPDELYTDGDQVGVATSWVPSTTFEGMDGSTLKAVFDEMKAHRPSAKSNAKNWAGFILTGTGGRSREQAKKILKRWIDNGVIADEAAWSAARNKVSSLIPVEAKVTEILTSLDIPMSPSEE